MIFNILSFVEDNFVTSDKFRHFIVTYNITLRTINLEKISN